MANIYVLSTLAKKRVFVIPVPQGSARITVSGGIHRSRIEEAGNHAAFRLRISE